MPTESKSALGGASHVASAAASLGQSGASIERSIKLKEGAHSPHMIATAPAGFGKTTLLATCGSKPEVWLEGRLGHGSLRA